MKNQFMSIFNIQFLYVKGVLDDLRGERSICELRLELFNGYLILKFERIEFYDY